jgi:hypothetical protein
VCVFRRVGAALSGPALRRIDCAIVTDAGTLYVR